MINLLSILVFMVTLSFYTFFARYFLEFTIPREKRQYYDMLSRSFRFAIIGFLSEFLHNTIDEKEDKPEYNMDVILLTRFFVPFVMMFYIYSNVYLLLNRYVYGQLLFTSIFLFLFEIYLFLNIAPSLEDFAYLHDSIGYKPLIVKMILLAHVYHFLHPLVLVFLFLFPFSIIDLDPIKVRYQKMLSKKYANSISVIKVGHL